eukprot:36585-Pelagomonas_calceolata.AAC.2
MFVISPSKGIYQMCCALTGRAYCRNFCPDIHPFSTLEAASAQHAGTKTRLKTAAQETQTETTRKKAKSSASKLSCHAIQRLTTIINTRHALHFHGTSGEGGVLGAWQWQWRAGGGESGRPGAWRTTLQILISSVSGFILG